MKKLICTLLACSIMCGVAFSQDKTQKTPDLLKNRANFEKSELFDTDFVFSNREVNDKVIKDYEASPLLYSDESLLPVAICYMTVQNVDKAKELLKKFLVKRPKNIQALNVLGTLEFLTKNEAGALELYKKAYALGDRECVKSMANIALATRKIEGIAPYAEDMKKMAKTDLQPFEIMLIYANRDPKKFDERLYKELISSLDVDAALKTATFDTLQTSVNLYLGHPELWTGKSVLIPARGAVIASAWPLANELYNKVLEKDKNNTMALRGRAIVEYNIGGVIDAAKLVKKAIDLNDKDAINDAMELYLLSKDEKIWDMFSKYFKGSEFLPNVRLNMLVYATQSDDKPELFYMALTGKGSELLLSEKNFAELINKGLGKYGSDKRSVDIKSKMAK